MFPRIRPLDFLASESQSLQGQENLSSSSILFFILLLPFLPLLPSSLSPHFLKLYLFKEEFKSEIQTLLLESWKFSFDLPVSLFLLLRCVSSLQRVCWAITKEE